jgi:membrane protease YdiL (CAAX protease family)
MTAPGIQVEHPSVGGRRLLAALIAGGAAATLLGLAAYYSLRPLFSGAGKSLLTQLIVLEVYLILIAGFRVAFGPLQGMPVALRFSSWRDVGLACAVWLITLAALTLCYWVISPVTGGFMNTIRLLINLGTDAKRLQGQPLSSWIVAVVRGCLVAPVFEEVLFRGLLLQWLKRHMSVYGAIAIAAALFAVMHVYPVLMLYAFVYGLATGLVRERTGSTFNPLIMHTLNNVLLLSIGLAIFN